MLAKEIRDIQAVGKRRRQRAPCENRDLQNCQVLEIERKMFKL